CSFVSSRRRHTRSTRDWSSDVCSSDLPQEYLDSGADAIVEGEAEQTLEDLLRQSGPLEKIPGILFRNPDGSVARTEARPLIADQIGRASCRERGSRALGEEALQYRMRR